MNSHCKLFSDDVVMRMKIERLPCAEKNHGQWGYGNASKDLEEFWGNYGSCTFCTHQVDKK